MTEVMLFELAQAVETQLGGKAAFVQGVPVHETHNGQTVWDGIVHVFDLTGHPRGAFRAYAWCRELEGGKRQPVVIMHTPQIKGPREAVAVAMVRDARSRGS